MDLFRYSVFDGFPTAKAAC